MTPLPTKIPVTLQLETGDTFTPPAPINLGSAEWVEWVFPEDFPNDLAYIHFESGSPLGPFQSLSFQGRSVIGMGNSGQPGTYSYKAMVLGLNSPVVTSPSATIVNQVSALGIDTSPEVIVRFVPGTLTSLPSLTVDPNPLELQVGQTATWHFFDLPADLFVTFRFPAFPNLTPGPFTSFFLSARLAEEATTMSFLARGEGYGLGNSPGATVEYHIALRDANGNVVASHDPAIDTLGDPPPARV